MFKRFFPPRRSPEKNSIDFFCLEKDPPLNIVLEPMASAYIVNPGESIQFIPVEPTSEFRWSVRMDQDSKALHLYPDITGSFKNIRVLLNEELIDQV